MLALNNGTSGSISSYWVAPPHRNIQSDPFIVYGPGQGGYSTGLLTDLNGADDLGTRYSYCVEPDKESPLQPLQGEYTGSGRIDRVVTFENDKGKWNALRNICYYAPSYPGYDENVGGVKQKYYTGNFSKDWGIAHLAMSWVWEGRSDTDLKTWNGTKASACGEVWTKAKALANAMWRDGTRSDDLVPDAFEVFICYQSSVQNMLVGMLEMGTLKLEKSSTNPGLSNNKNCYSLAGAEYQVIDSKGRVVETLTTDKDGKTKEIELATGEYTIEEVTAAKGFALNKTTYKVTIKAGEDTVKKVTDDPENDPFVILLNKIDKETGKKSELAGASLEGAVFEIKYYDAIYSKVEDAKKSDLKKTWKLKTDEKGRIKIPQTDLEMKTYFVSGGEFEKIKDGKTNTFAIGSYVIREIKAPDGYEVNPEPQLAVVPEDPNSTTETVRTYNMLTSKGEKIYEQVERGDLEFIKKKGLFCFTEKGGRINTMFNFSRKEHDAKRYKYKRDNRH